MVAPSRFKTPERVLQRQVVALAELCGWLAWHDVDPRRNAGGFPDLLLLKAGHPPLWLELKREGGRLRPAQVSFHALLRACGQEVHVIYPSDWPRVELLLQRAGQGADGL